MNRVVSTLHKFWLMDEWTFSSDLKDWSHQQGPLREDSEGKGHQVSGAELKKIKLKS